MEPKPKGIIINSRGDISIGGKKVSESEVEIAGKIIGESAKRTIKKEQEKITQEINRCTEEPGLLLRIIENLRNGGFVH